MSSLMMSRSPSVASLFFLRKRTNLYLEKSSTQSMAYLMPARDVSWKGPERSTKSLPARLSSRQSVDFGTAYRRTRASEQCTHGLQVPLS